ncbi:MAG: hypothetical protein JST59_17420 [Actinobacteria bacterium]|nr:hypothetical protein [Actinomycetota bacterium]
MRRIAALIFALLALGLVAAGCGGGGNSTGGSTESSGTAPTKAAFIKEGDEICTKDEAELNKEIEAFAEENNIDIEKAELTSDQETELFQELVLPNIAKQGEDLAALTPPEGDEETIEELTDTLNSEVEEAEEEGGKPGNDTLAEASKLAKAYGFKSCGS